MPELAYGALPVPATPIRDLLHWRLDIRCGRCNRNVVLHLDSLAKRYNQRARIGEVIRRLRCDGFRQGNRCGGKPSKVTLAEVQAYGKSVRKVREVTVVGG